MSSLHTFGKCHGPERRYSFFPLFEQRAVEGSCSSAFEAKRRHASNEASPDPEFQMLVQMSRFTLL